MWSTDVPGPESTAIAAHVDSLLADMPPRELVEKAVAAATARIVAWLRRSNYDAAADAIERGEHVD